MLKKLCAALLALSSVCASAAETTWKFEYQGFVDAATGEFNADRKFYGSFSGSDSNADGIISLDELTSLNSDGYSFIEPGDGGCLANWTPYLRCEIGSFNYKLTGELDYALHHWGNDEYVMGWYGSVRTGDRFIYGSYSDVRSSESTYLWSDRTTFTISPAPVPEPGTLPMALAGLALVGLAARRAKVAL